MSGAPRHQVVPIDTQLLTILGSHQHWLGLSLRVYAGIAFSAAGYEKGSETMIARVWRGWTRTEDADAYERLLREVVYPGLQQITGYHGGYILRQDRKDETEFVTVNLFESLEAVQAFAGPDYEVPVFEPEARRLLSKVEPIARHYDVKKAPQLL